MSGSLRKKKVMQPAYRYCVIARPFRAVAISWYQPNLRIIVDRWGEVSDYLVDFAANVYNRLYQEIATSLRSSQ